MDNPVSESPDPGRFGLRGVLVTMCLCLVLVVASVSALNLALPDLAISLHASNRDLTWIADGYTVALAALVLPLGALGDRLGRRNVLVAGTVVFGAAALAAALSGSTGQLIAARVVMGVGAAMIMPGTLSTITAAFPPDKRSRGVATWAGFAAAGAIIGLVVAGALLERWGWESIFLTSAVTALVAGAAALVLAPNTSDEHPGRLDLPGGLCTALAIGTLVFAIIEGNESSWTERAVLVALTGTVIGIAGYVVLGLRAQEPLLDPRLFALRGFRAGGITIVVQFMAVFGFFFVGLQYLQLILGYSPLQAAVALIPVAAVVLPTSQLTPRLVQRIGLKYVMSGGLVLLATGMLWISRLDVGSGYLPFLVGLVVAGLGIGLTSSTGTSAVVGSLPRDKQGVASAVNDATREVGSAIGIALMGSVYSNTYAESLPDLSALPPDASAAVRDSAATGLDVADRLEQHGAQLADAVRAAFMDGLSASLVVIGVVVLVAALGVLIRAPRRDDVRTDAADGPSEAGLGDA
jgi:EmrB/QacA subfamily drug resistance transporter